MAPLTSVVDLLMRTGSTLLQHGADAGRVEASLQALGPGLGIDRIDALVMSKSLLLTAARGGERDTRIVRVPIAGVNLNILNELEGLLDRFRRGEVDAGQLPPEVDRIAGLPQLYSPPVILTATGAACAAFCRLFGGDWTAVVITGAAAALAATVRIRLNARRANYFLVALLTALTASLAAGTARWLSDTPRSALSAAVLLLVPGVPLLNASTDILRGYVSAGLTRAVTSLTVFLAIALGLGLVVRLLRAV